MNQKKFSVSHQNCSSVSVALPCNYFLGMNVTLYCQNCVCLSAQFADTKCALMILHGIFLYNRWALCHSLFDFYCLFLSCNAWKLSDLCHYLWDPHMLSNTHTCTPSRWETRIIRAERVRSIKSERTNMSDFMTGFKSSRTCFLLMKWYSTERTQKMHFHPISVCVAKSQRCAFISQPKTQAVWVTEKRSTRQIQRLFSILQCQRVLAIFSTCDGATMMKLCNLHEAESDMTFLKGCWGCFMSVFKC